MERIKRNALMTFVFVAALYAVLATLGVVDPLYGVTNWSTSSHASASDDLWNFGAILGKGRGNFRSLCSSENGKLVKDDESTLSCKETRGADVSASFKEGVATIYGMSWENSSAGLQLLSSLRQEMGKEDFSDEADGCHTYWWVNPHGNELTYVVGICSMGSYTIVGFV